MGLDVGVSDLSNTYVFIAVIPNDLNVLLVITCSD
jgi:hypothetical protein